MTARGQLRSRYAALAVFVIAASTTCAGDEPAPREAFITNQSGQSLSIIDLATFKVVDEIKIGGKPAGIALSSDGKRAFVTAPEGNELVIVDVISRRVAKRITMSGGPLGIA
ncbi:MAG: YncE family protein, partial [Hyphomicrobium sp.]